MGSRIEKTRLKHAAAAGIALVLMAPVAKAGACAPDRVELRGPWGTAQFSVEIADDPDERAVGLMNRQRLPMSAGMLFLYERPQNAVFWMKDTLIPLDMVFIDPTGTVTRVHDRAKPRDLTAIDGGPGVLAVLEINGGLGEALGIGPGTEVRHPGLPQDSAAWPCSDR